MSNPQVVQLISKNFVPIAVDLLGLRNGQGEDGKLYLDIHKQKPQWQGVWILSPKGKVLHSYLEIKSHKRFTEEFLAALKTGLARFGPVAERKVKWVNPMPYRGQGVQPDGKVQALIYIRYLRNGQPVGPGVLDSLTLSAKEWMAFAPTKKDVGFRWEVNKKVAAKLSRCLSPDSDNATMPLPKETTRVKLIGKVHSMKGNEVTLVYDGSIAMKHMHPYQKGKFSYGDADIEGTATYDAKTGTMQSLTLILVGDFHNFQPYDQPARPIAAGVKWVR